MSLLQKRSLVLVKILCMKIVWIIIVFISIIFLALTKNIYGFASLSGSEVVRHYCTKTKHVTGNNVYIYSYHFINIFLVLLQTPSTLQPRNGELYRTVVGRICVSVNSKEFDHISIGLTLRTNIINTTQNPGPIFSKLEVFEDYTLLIIWEHIICCPLHIWRHRCSQKNRQLTWPRL